MSSAPPAAAAASRPGAPRGEGGPAARARRLTALVDARGLLTSGIGRYVREVLPALIADPRVARVTLLGDAPALRDFCAPLEGGEKARVLPYDHGFYTPAAQAAWLALRVRGVAAADVAFFPHYDVPCLGLPERTVVTVHDLIHFKVPEVFPAWRRAGAGVLLRSAVGGAARVIAVSEATRRDLAERFPSAAAKVRVVPNGVSSCFRTAPAEPAGELPAGIRPPYLLCVGNRKPHKNLGAAVEALALLRRERPELRLVVAGEAYRGWEAVLERAAALGVREHVVELEGVSDAGLRALYAGCEALLFPSLYEGFGLPVLEAMACGAPVVASDRSAIPEVVGDAGLLVRPDDPPAMAGAVRRLWGEPGLRAELARRGRARSAAYSWERTARETVDLLCQVAEGSSRPQPAG